jgi:multiple sugar transport system substrate-binding protein
MSVWTASTSRRSLFKAGALTAAAAALTACGGSGPGSDSGPVTLRFAWWGADVRAAYTQKIIDAFHAKNPTITVKAEWVEWSGYWDRMATSVAANDAPDVIQMDASYLRSYADRGALLDLSREASLKTDDIDPTALATGKTSEGLFGLAAGITSVAVLLNTGLAKQAHLQRPDDKTWTWKDYATYAAQITNAKLPGGVHGAASGGLDEPGLQLWAAQRGQHLYDDQGKVVLDPAVAAEWWQYQVDLMHAGAVAPASVAVESMGGSIDQSPTSKNQVALSPVFANQVTAYTDAGAENIVLLRPPAQTAGGSSGLSYKSAMYWSVSSRTKHPKESIAFLNFLENSPEAADLMLAERGIPANTVMRDRIAPKLSPTDALALDYIDSIADVVQTPPPVPPAGASGADAMVQRYGSDVLFGKRTPTDAAKAFIEELADSVESA